MFILQGCLIVTRVTSFKQTSSGASNFASHYFSRSMIVSNIILKRFFIIIYV